MKQALIPLKDHIMKNMFSLISTYISWSSLSLQTPRMRKANDSCMVSAAHPLVTWLSVTCSSYNYITKGVIFIGRLPLSDDGIYPWGGRSPSRWSSVCPAMLEKCWKVPHLSSVSSVGLSWDMCANITTDGTASMTGKNSGVMRRILDRAPSSTWKHCLFFFASGGLGSKGCSASASWNIKRCQTARSNHSVSYPEPFISCRPVQQQCVARTRCLPRWWVWKIKHIKCVYAGEGAQIFEQYDKIDAFKKKRSQCGHTMFPKTDLICSPLPVVRDSNWTRQEKMRWGKRSRHIWRNFRSGLVTIFPRKRGMTTGYVTPLEST